MNVKTLGIAGGIGPESTAAYYRCIIETYRKQRTDGGYPPLIINSIDMTAMLEFVEKRALADLTRYLLEAVDRLAAAGAHCGNTPRGPDPRQRAVAMIIG